MKISFISTVLNEEKTIEQLLKSLERQTRLANEIVITEAGSTDKTLNLIEKFQKETPALMIRIIKAKGVNRAQGRNEAIKKATGEIIAIADAGCELDKNWLAEIIKPFSDPKIDVVAGYYQAKPKNIFEKCMVPYVLVMPDKVNQREFLPASRSMAIRKGLWQKFGGFPENFSDNEDYVFANRLKNGGAKIVFVKEAIVYWFPRTNLKDFFEMIYRFARGDAQAGLRYPKMATVFLRYLGVLFLIIFPSFICFSILLFLYFLWAVWKNYRYVRHSLAFIYLPCLQITADLAVMVGFLKGMIK